MITPADSDYHSSDPSERTWAETIVMVFSVPEAGILGNAYVLARPNVGAAISAVTVHSGFCTQPYQMDFTDPQVHVPAPERFSDFTLPTGLSVKVTDAPRDFQVRYEHELGACRLDLAFQALHDPFDVHDPEQNPLVAGTDGPLDTGLGDVWANGHFDAVGHVTGTLELRGREYQVDCFDGMDRSWGPRAELGNRGASWIHVTFDTGFAVHLGMALDYRDGEIVYDGLRFGYVVEDGQVYGVTQASVQARRIEMISVSNHITLTDTRGRSYEFFGTAVGGAPWHSFSPAYISYQSLFRYEYDGRVGHAEATDVIGLEFLAERMSRHGRQQSLPQPPAWPSERSGARSTHLPTKGDPSMSTTQPISQSEPRPATMEPAIAETLERKRERRGQVTHVPVSTEEFAERLRTFLASRITGDFTVSGLGRLAGGASKEQFVFDLDWDDAGVRRSDRMVLRMDPPASMVETSRSREFELLRSLDGVLPVPPVYWLTEDPTELGGPAMVCGYVAGTASASEGVKTASGLGTTYGPRLRGLLGPQFVEHLATLHRHDWRSSELPHFERPQEGSTEAIDWRLASIDAAWEQDSFEPHPTVTLARRWLWEHRPPVDHVSVVHGDYRNGNFLFDEESGQITSVLDWELCYLGDRHHDLAYAMMAGWGEQDAATGEFYASALVTPDELIATYERLSGLQVDQERLRYYTAVNLYWAVVALIGTGPRNAADKMTHLDVMQNFLAGLGARFLADLHEIVTAQ